MLAVPVLLSGYGFHLIPRVDLVEKCCWRVDATTERNSVSCSDDTLIYWQNILIDAIHNTKSTRQSNHQELLTSYREVTPVGCALISTKFTPQPMDVLIQHKPSFALAVVKLGPSEEIKAEPGSMVSHSCGVTTDTKMIGELMGGLK